MNFRPDIRGATSVIGTVLLVGITVILVAVVGATTLTLADRVQNPPPAVTIETDQQRGVVVETNEFNGTDSSAQENLSVTLTHISGAAVDPDRLSVTVNGYPAYDVFNPNRGFATIARAPARSTFGAGTRLRVVVYGDRVYTDASESPSGDPSFFHNTGTLKRSLDDPTAGQRANELRPGDTIRLIWTSPSGLNSYVIKEYTVQ